MPKKFAIQRIKVTDVPLIKKLWYNNNALRSNVPAKLVPNQVKRFWDDETLFLGRVIRFSRLGVNQWPLRLVRVQRNQFNVYLLKYFSSSMDYWALDANEVSKLGDVVLIKKIPDESSPSVKVLHEINKIVFEHGNLRDPVTKKRIMQRELQEDIERRGGLIDEAIAEGLESVRMRRTSRQEALRNARLQRKVADDEATIRF